MKLLCWFHVAFTEDNEHELKISSHISIHKVAENDIDAYRKCVDDIERYHPFKCIRSITVVSTEVLKEV